MNYALSDSDYQLTVGAGEDADTYDRKGGDWDFIPAGPDHNLYAGSGKKVHYIWSNSIPTREANKREECYYELSLCIQHGCGDSV